jgi:2-keto-4-pentenoate hydratase/2-oxohepta-3-ene-1,7-dioic acid hydratase in catechol pathway
VSPEHALDYVFGYTAANDVTARDCQKNDKQWVRAKGFDTFCPLGPVLVTADEFDPHDVQIQSRLNGELMQDASTNAMLFNVPELISYLSHQFTLRPGTLLLTGTPEGVGFVRQPPVFLRDGDEIEVFVAGIGRLANCVFSSTNRA